MTADAALLRTLLLSRLSQYPAGQLTRTSIIDIVVAVAIEAGLIVGEVQPISLSPQQASMALAVATEALRVNMRKTSSLSTVATAVLDALADYGFHFTARNPGGEVLRPRQYEVLSLAAQGMTNEEIHLITGLGLGTVRSHLEAARRALHARNTTHAVAIAQHRGLINLTSAPPVQSQAAA